MAFPKNEVEELLVRCHRSCCICHRFCGVKIETDHLVPKAQQGKDDIENAIPVCFNCHAEIHCYNDKHPRGRKFTTDELRQHKAYWLKKCDDMLGECRTSDVEIGPIQALIDEIEFNIAAAKASAERGLGCLLRDEQFARAIRTGSLSVLLPELKNVIIDAYVAVSHASVVGQAATQKRAGGVSTSVSGTRSSDPVAAYRQSEIVLRRAHEQLLGFLGRRAL